MSATKGDERRESKVSRFRGVTWNKVSNSWQVQLWDPQTKRNEHIGYYASEVDTARASDCAAVKLLGLGTKRNFPAEVISEPPVSLGAKMRESEASRFSFGVRWHKRGSVWQVDRWNPETKRTEYIAMYSIRSDPTPPRWTQPGRTTARL
ncbi:hypothetical protein FOA52_004076 [Chlamydomonas sp. UWO 241]|nr:hypothetical protein FOA52_004076 [Chlamydomonas sp. UWO 241]